MVARLAVFGCVCCGVEALGFLELGFGVLGVTICPLGPGGGLPDGLPEAAERATALVRLGGSMCG